MRVSFLRGGAVAARLAHNQEVVGSSPTPATSFPLPLQAAIAGGLAGLALIGLACLFAPPAKSETLSCVIDPNFQVAVCPPGLQPGAMVVVVAGTAGAAAPALPPAAGGDGLLPPPAASLSPEKLQRMFLLIQAMVHGSGSLP